MQNTTQMVPSQNVLSGSVAIDPKREQRANWCIECNELSFLQFLCVNEKYIYVPSHLVMELSLGSLRERVRMLYSSSTIVQRRAVTFDHWISEQRIKYAQQLRSKDIIYSNGLYTGFIDQMIELESYGSYYPAVELNYDKGQRDMSNLMTVKFSDDKGLWESIQKESSTNILNNNNHEQVSTASIGIEQHQRGSCISSPGRESEIATSTGFIGNAFCIIRRPVILSESTQSGSVFNQEHPGSQTESGRFDEWSSGSRITTEGPLRGGVYSISELSHSGDSVRKRK